MVIDKNNILKKFKPLNVMSNDWLDWFIEKYNIELCELYYPPYNFTRTGCLGCPFNIKIQKDLATLKELLPNEYRKASLLWKPVYDEYKRLNYRIKDKTIGELNNE